MQEGVGLLVLLDAFVEPVKRLRPDRFENGLPSPMGGLRPHQDSNLVEFLPLAVEGEQGADLEVSGRDVERFRDAGPLLQVPEPGPAGDTVVDDEELAALGVSGHDTPVRTSSRGAGGGGSSSWLTVALASREGICQADSRRFAPVAPASPFASHQRYVETLPTPICAPRRRTRPSARRGPFSRSSRCSMRQRRSLQMNVGIDIPSRSRASPSSACARLSAPPATTTKSIVS